MRRRRNGSPVRTTDARDFRFTLFEIFFVITFAAATVALFSRGERAMATCVAITAVAFLKVRFSLLELFLLMTFSSLCLAMITQGAPALAICLLITCVSFRTSVIDFTMIGECSVLLTVVFGMASIALLVIRTAGW